MICSDWFFFDSLDDDVIASSLQDGEQFYDDEEVRQSPSLWMLLGAFLKRVFSPRMS